MDARLARYGRTSEQFKRWLRANPNVGKKRRIEAFNSIADTEFENRVLKTPKKAKKATRVK